MSCGGHSLYLLPPPMLTQATGEGGAVPGEAGGMEAAGGRVGTRHCVQ